MTMIDFIAFELGMIFFALWLVVVGLERIHKTLEDRS